MTATNKKLAYEAEGLRKHLLRQLELKDGIIQEIWEATREWQRHRLSHNDAMVQIAHVLEKAGRIKVMTTYCQYRNAAGDATPEFEDRYDAVADKVANFDGSLILMSIVEGWTVAETIGVALEVEAEQIEYAMAMDDDYASVLDHDMSMNG